MPQFWYEFRAYNSQAIYGFGTAKEAGRYEDYLNSNRSTNHYTGYQLPGDLVAELKLENRDDTFNLDDALAALASD